MKAQNFRWPASITQRDRHRFKEAGCSSSKPSTLSTSLTLMDSVGTKREILVQSKESWGETVNLKEKTRVLSCLEIVLKNEKAVLRKRKPKIILLLVAP